MTFVMYWICERAKARADDKPFADRAHVYPIRIRTGWSKAAPARLQVIGLEWEFDGDAADVIGRHVGAVGAKDASCVPAFLHPPVACVSDHVLAAASWPHGAVGTWVRATTQCAAYAANIAYWAGSSPRMSVLVTDAQPSAGSSRCRTCRRGANCKAAFQFRKTVNLISTPKYLRCHVVPLCELGCRDTPARPPVRPGLPKLQSRCVVCLGLAIIGERFQTIAALRV